MLLKKSHVLFLLAGFANAHLTEVESNRGTQLTRRDEINSLQAVLQ